jgi:PAS domain S-box-containing protein
VLSGGLAGTPFFLVCATLGLVMFGMAANEWRRLGTNDYRRVALAAGLLLTTRLAGALLLALGLSTTPCLEWALEGLTLALFTWAFLLKTFAAPRQATIILLVSVGMAGALAAACGLVGDQPAWLALAWPAALVLLSGLGLAQWLRFWRRLSPWLGCAFLLSLAGGIVGLTGFGQVAPALHLAALTLLAIETYRSILADLSAYGQELQSVSERALRQTQEMAFLLEVSHAIASSLDLSVVLERVSESVARAMNADWAYILLPVEGNDEALSIAARYGWWGRRVALSGPAPSQVLVRFADFVLLRVALTTGEQVLANEPAEYEPFDRLHDLLGRPQTGPTLVQPILVKKQTLGVLLLGHVREEAVFSPADAKLCEALAAQVATAIENARLYQSVDEQARRLANLLRVREEDLTQRQAILESIADGVVVAGNAGDVLLANAAAERILGLPRKQLIGQTIKRLYAELLRTRGRGKGEQAIFEWGDRLVRGSLAPVKMPDGALLGYVAVFRDVTHERQAELSKSEFIATVSHELRTPMTSIKGYVDLLRFGAVGGLNPQQIHFLEVVGKNSERMIGLVNNLIAVSEMERGSVRIDLQRVDMKGVIEEAVQAVRSEATDRQLDLIVSVPPGLPPAHGDPDRLRQVLDNLLDNALHYTPEGGRIDVWATEANLESGECHLVVSVRDTGVGIRPEEQERIFEKFYRAENPLSVEAGGTGMGLAIVKTLVEAHGGRVWVESRLGQGSTFRFAMPALVEKT